jgi:hypothetical protein
MSLNKGKRKAGEHKYTYELIQAKFVPKTHAIIQKFEQKKQHNFLFEEWISSKVWLTQLWEERDAARVLRDAGVTGISAIAVAQGSQVEASDVACLVVFLSSALYKKLWNRLLLLNCSHSTETHTHTSNNKHRKSRIIESRENTARIMVFAQTDHHTQRERRTASWNPTATLKSPTETENRTVANPCLCVCVWERERERETKIKTAATIIKAHKMLYENKTIGGHQGSCTDGAQRRRKTAP